MSESVKLGAFCPGRIWLRLGLGFALPLGIFATCPALGQVDPAGLSAPAVTKPALDPLLPTGSAWNANPARPNWPDRAVCSFSRPVCVHRAERVTAQTALQALARLEGAYERLVLVLGLPTPLPDRALGGNDSLDLYLGNATENSRQLRRTALSVGNELPELTAFDQAAGYCVLENAEVSSAESLERFATLCVAEAIALRLDASETPHLRRAIASELWLSVGRPTAEDFEAIDDLQARPERALATRDRQAHSDGVAVLFDYLERERAVARFGMLSLGLLALSAGKTAPAALQWNNEPDLFDVIRHTFAERRPEVAALFGDLAVSRAFLGNRDDGSHLPFFAWSGAFGRIRFDWMMKFSSLPRRVASTQPIEPTGSIYLWLELDDLPLGAVVGFQASWEAPVSFKWSLARVDKDGSELSRIDVPFQESATSIEARATNLEAAAGLLIVGTNLGGVDLAHPFDPDVTPFEAHGCTVYLAKL